MTLLSRGFSMFSMFHWDNFLMMIIMAMLLMILSRPFHSRSHSVQYFHLLMVADMMNKMGNELILMILFCSRCEFNFRWRMIMIMTEMRMSPFETSCFCCFSHRHWSALAQTVAMGLVLQVFR